MSYSTIGFVKTINLANHTFTIEPIQNYKFIANEQKSEDWKIIFRPDDSNSLHLCVMEQQQHFYYPEELVHELITLKQSRMKVKVSVASPVMAILMKEPSLTPVEYMSLELV